MSATGCNPDFSFCLFLVWDYRELVTERRYFAGGGCFHWNLSLVGNTDGLNPMDEKKNEKNKDKYDKQSLWGCVKYLWNCCTCKKFFELNCFLKRRLI